MDRIAVLIPCFNEAPTIAKVVRDFRSALPDAMIYVYDNNSTDHTDEIARAAGAVVRYERQQGKGNVIRRMFSEIDAECYIMADGDDTYPADAAPDLAACVLERNADMVIGDRLTTTYFEENRRPLHGFGNRLVRCCIQSMFRRDIMDIMTGYRAFSYRFVKTCPILSRGFEVETEMSVHAISNDLQLEIVPVPYRDRPEGSTSKLHTVRDGIRVLYMLLKLYATYRPGHFFGLIALLLTMLSAAFGLPVLVEYFRTGLVERFPTLIVCGFTVVAAIQSLFSGLILHVLNTKHRQNFEMQLDMVELMKRRELC